MRRAQAIAESVNLARDFVNTPPNDLRPPGFATSAAEAAAAVGIDTEILDEKALKAGGYGGIMSVGQGSAAPPRLLRLAYRHPDATQHLALIGKGITFDTGGISIKPAAGMEAMKSDMGGAAAVIAATIAVARLGLAVNVTTYAPMAENMPSGPRRGRPTSSSPTAARPSRCSTPTPRAGSSCATRSPARPRTPLTSSSTSRR